MRIPLEGDSSFCFVTENLLAVLQGDQLQIWDMVKQELLSSKELRKKVEQGRNLIALPTGELIWRSGNNINVYSAVSNALKPFFPVKKENKKRAL